MTTLPRSTGIATNLIPGEEVPERVKHNTDRAGLPRVSHTG